MSDSSEIWCVVMVFISLFKFRVDFYNINIFRLLTVFMIAFQSYSQVL
ncbi:hypothetical protein [Moraxella lacunata]